jgi:hypothetical protein
LDTIILQANLKGSSIGYGYNMGEYDGDLPYEKDIGEVHMRNRLE